MNPSSIDIKDMLEDDSSLGLTFATDLFVGKEPEDPRNVVTIFDTPGGRPAITNDKDAYYYPSVQIRIRNTDYETGYALGESIEDYLHDRAQETWNGTLYSNINSSNGVFFLDWDANNNARFIINLEIQRR